MAWSHRDGFRALSVITSEKQPTRLEYIMDTKLFATIITVLLFSTSCLIVVCFIVAEIGVSVVASAVGLFLLAFMEVGGLHSPALSTIKGSPPRAAFLFYDSMRVEESEHEYAVDYLDKSPHSDFLALHCSSEIGHYLNEPNMGNAREIDRCWRADAKQRVMDKFARR